MGSTLDRDYKEWLISDQKRQVCKNKTDPDTWQEPGRLKSLNEKDLMQLLLQMKK
jgi:hypothetical protein